VLVTLLNSAQQALAWDGKEARQLVAKAADILKAEVERLEASDHAAAPAPVNRHLAPWQTRRVIEFVEENLAGTIRIDGLTTVTRLSARQLSRAFRSDFGEAPYAYVVRRRIERAKETMLLTDEPLANIAAKCGLSDQPHLTRLFRRIVGESPARWRRRRRAARRVGSTVGDAPCSGQLTLPDWIGQR
jgi:transcriptional regulator GlxA family with amidase domain